MAGIVLLMKRGFNQAAEEFEGFFRVNSRGERTVCLLGETQIPNHQATFNRVTRNDSA